MTTITGRYLVNRLSVNTAPPGSGEYQQMPGRVELQRLVSIDENETLAGAPLQISIKGTAALYNQFSGSRRTFIISFKDGEPLP